MQVGELIEALQGYPEDATVYVDYFTVDMDTNNAVNITLDITDIDENIVTDTVYIVAED